MPDDKLYYVGGARGGATRGIGGPAGSGFYYKGIWTGGQYIPRDVVGLSGRTYICIQTVTDTGITNTTFWNQVSDTGVRGVTGLQGIRGVSGTTGPLGLTGLTGPTGASGSTGPIGLSGIRGPSGLPYTLSNLSGVSISSQSSGQVLKFTTLWSNQADSLGPGGGGTLVSLTGVNPTGISNNDLLVYDSGRNVWIPKFTAFPVWNVKDFGASGDGINNDINAILAARTAVNTSGGTIYFPGGNFFKAVVDSSNSGTFAQNNGLLYITRSYVQIVADNDAYIQIFANVALSGETIASSYCPMFQFQATNCRVKGGVYSLAWTGTNVIFTGAGFNGYPLYWNNTASPLMTSFENCTFSGFAGGALNGGVTNAFGEQIENTYWKNCRFLNWGGAYHDNLIYHQGRTTFDTCQFIQRPTWFASGDLKEHSHAIYTGANRPYSMYKNCIFRNIGTLNQGLGNRAYPLHFYGNVPTFRSYGIIVDNCLLTSTSNYILLSDVHDKIIFSNTVGGWSEIGSPLGNGTTSLNDATVSVVYANNLIAYNNRLQYAFTASDNTIINNTYDTVISINGTRNAIITNCSFRNDSQRIGKELTGGILMSAAGIGAVSFSLYNVLITNNSFESNANNWAMFYRSFNKTTWVDNLYDAPNGGAISQIIFDAGTPSFNSWIGNHFYNSASAYVNYFEMTNGNPSRTVLLNNVINTPNIITNAGTAFISATYTAGKSGLMIKGNTFLNTWRPYEINFPHYAIGNHYHFSGTNFGTGVLLLNLYNTTGTI